jgi:outer membrane protein assembly factor BamB
LAAISRVQLIFLLTVLIVATFVAAYAIYYALKSGSTPSFFSSTAGNPIGSSVSISSFTRTSSTNASEFIWPTYHGDYSRDGIDSKDNAIQGRIHSDWNSTKLDGRIYGEPLLGEGMVFAATENNSVYALNETNGRTIWRTNLGTPVPGSSLPCGDIDPSGITGTPVIDTSTGIIYVVSFLSPAHHELFGLDTSNGNVVFEHGADPPSPFDPTVEQQRASLSFYNGVVYVPFGGLDGDCGNYHGWIVGVETNSTASSLLSYMVPSIREGGIWAPSGLAIDSSGNIYAATGNSASNSASDYDYGNAVIRLSPSLNIESYFAPTNWISLNQGDTDLGSVGPAIVGPSTIFQVGKEGVGYLLNTKDLGGIGGGVFSSTVCSEAYGGTAFDSTDVYVGCMDGLHAVQRASGSFNILWSSSTQFYAGPPIVAGGLVWTVGIYDATLDAYGMQNGTLVFSHSLGSVVTFTTPSAGYGQIFVGGNDEIQSFGL